MPYLAPGPRSSRRSASPAPAAAPRAALAALASAAGLTACGGGGGEIGVSCSAPEVLTGEATYYGADGTGACGFGAITSGEVLVAALPETDWDGASLCGACARVDGPNGSVIVRIVDQCPECKHGDLDLSQLAFERIAALESGRVAMSWYVVPCEVRGPIEYHFKDGSNPFWTAIQIRNHRHPIASVEAREADGAWRELPREPYNYFVADPGLGDGPYALRVTDRVGNALVDEEVPLGDDSTTAGAAQLPACP